MNEVPNLENANSFDEEINSPILPMSEQIRLIAIFLYKCPKNEATTEQLQVVMDWANDALLNKGLLDAVLAGDMFVHMDEETEELAFSLTPKGIQSAQALITTGPDLELLSPGEIAQ